MKASSVGREGVAERVGWESGRYRRCAGARRDRLLEMREERSSERLPLSNSWLLKAEERRKEEKKPL